MTSCGALQREDIIPIALAAKLSHITEHQDPHGLAECLRTNEMTIVCGYDNWSMSSENAAIQH